MAKKKKSSVSPIWIIVLLFLLPILVWAVYQRISLAPSARALFPPIFGNALYVGNDGYDDTYAYATSTRILSQNPFTVETWIKYPKPQTGTYLREYPVVMYTKPQSPVDRGYIFSLSLEVQEQTGTARPFFSALLANSTSSLNSNYVGTGDPSVILQPDVWYHLAATSYSEGNTCYVALFVNGVLASQGSRFRTNCQISTQQPQQFRLARHHESTSGISGYNYAGHFDELRISNTRKYTANFTPAYAPFTPLSDTLLLYHFDESAAATSILDASTSTMHALLVGTHKTFVRSTLPPISPTPFPTVTLCRRTNVKCLNGGAQVMINGKCACPPTTNTQ